MPTLEMVEKLRQYADVTYDEAKAALEACGDDLLEAVIYLEKQGKTNRAQDGGFYSSQQEHAQSSNITCINPGKASGEGFADMMRRFWNWLRQAIHKGNNNYFTVTKKGQNIISLPVTALLLLSVLCLWGVLILLIVALFCGCSCQFHGPQMEDTKINDVMNSAAKVADNLKNEVMSSEQKHKDDSQK